MAQVAARNIVIGDAISRPCIKDSRMIGRGINGIWVGLIGIGIMLWVYTPLHTAGLFMKGFAYDMNVSRGVPRGADGT